MTSIAKTPTASAVQALYEAFPYPYYPLLAKPVWQEGYAASSLFAGALSRALTGQTLRTPASKILCVGSGEILPYVLRQLEPRKRDLLCVDISRRSLRRARWRQWLSMKSLVKRAGFIHSDLDAFLEQNRERFDHIDAYGVLHHLADPAATMKRLAARLAPGGTLRLMVYNQPARAWIHEVQRAFALMRLSPYETTDRAVARKLLRLLASTSPSFGERLDAVGDETLRNDARLVDTFLHAREARLSISRWYDLIEHSGLSAFGLFDRYAELDDLANPLWELPSCKALEERAADRRFENNLELYLQRPSGVCLAAQNQSLWAQRLCRPPRRWFAFVETRAILPAQRWRLWHAHLAHLAKGEAFSPHLLAPGLPLPAWQRLARIGAVLPGQFKDAAFAASLREPMTSQMEAPSCPAPVSLAQSPLAQNVARELEVRGLERRFVTVMARFDRAQH